MKHWLCLLFPLFAHGLYTAYADLATLRSITPTSRQGSIISFDIATQLKGFELSPNKDKLIVKNPGVYFLVSTAQYGAMTPSATGIVDLWFGVNGKAVENSGSRGSIENYTDIYTVMTTATLVLKAGDTIENYFSADAPSIGMIFTQSDNEPACPSYNLLIFSLK